MDYLNVNFNEQEIAAAFLIFDKQNRGYITYKDFSEKLQTRESSSKFVKWEKDEDTREPNLAMLHQRIERYLDDRGWSFDKFFDKFDSQNLSLLSKRDLGELLDALNIKANELELSTYFKLLDLNNSGKIQKAEFKQGCILIIYINSVNITVKLMQ